MSALDEIIGQLVVVALIVPLIMVIVLGISALLPQRRARRVAVSVAAISMTLVTLCLVTAGVLFTQSASKKLVVVLGNWFDVGAGRFSATLLVDRLSLTFAILTGLIGGVVSAFSQRYLEREPGFLRYFILFATFVSGMLSVVLAGSIEVLMAGWELLGLSSALLVAFFHERPAPVHNGMRVFIAYRISDVAMISAVVLVHHYLGHGSLVALFAAAESGAVGLTSGQSAIIGILFAVAAFGKCAQLPLSGWLPRAMEGPTPSSAIFYGALSLHAGAFLLLRAAPILVDAPWVRGFVLAIAALTAVHAALSGRVQTDIKSALAFASLAQVSVILVEIALGWHRLAVVHMIGHICLRLLQFLRAPSVLHDFHAARAVAPSERGVMERTLARWISPRAMHWLYRFALERAYLDHALERFVVRPLLGAVKALDRLERRWCDWLVGEAPLRKGRAPRERSRR